MANLKDSILQKIKENEVRMKPKAYFTARMIALAAVALLILVLTVFIFNFIFFSMRVSHHMSLMRSGGHGFLLFLALFPWTLLLADVALIALLENLLRRFRFAYRHPALYIFLILLAVGISAGLVLDRHTPLNDHFLRRADEHGLPGPMNQFYEGARRLPPPGYRVEMINVRP